MPVTQLNGGTQLQNATVTPAKVTSGIIVAAGTNAFTGDQSMGSHKLTNVTDPASPQDAATKNYVDNAVVGLLKFKGTQDCSANPNYPAATKGDSYLVSVAGKIGGASGTSVDVGDWYVANADNAGGTEAGVGASWGHMEHNLVGALLASNNLSDVSTPATARTNLGATTVGGNLFTATNPSAITFVRVNADNSISLLSASVFRTAIGAIGGTIVTRETPSGTINGSNATFTLVNTPTAGTEHLYLNGILQDSGAGNDYTISGGTITMLNVPVSGDKLRCSYNY